MISYSNTNMEMRLTGCQCGDVGIPLFHHSDPVDIPPSKVRNKFVEPKHAAECIKLAVERMVKFKGDQEK